jgi:hypothetical protein
MDLPDLVFGQSSAEAGVGNEARLKGSSSVPKSLLEEMTAHCGNWKPALSKSRISFSKMLVPIFTGQILGMSDLDCTHFRFVPLTQRSMQGCHTGHLEAFWRANRAGRRAALSITPYMNWAGYCR